MWNIARPSQSPSSILGLLLIDLLLVMILAATDSNGGNNNNNDNKNKHSYNNTIVHSLTSAEVKNNKTVPVNLTPDQTCRQAIIGIRPDFQCKEFHECCQREHGMDSLSRCVLQVTGVPERSLCTCSPKQNHPKTLRVLPKDKHCDKHLKTIQKPKHLEYTCFTFHHCCIKNRTRLSNIGCTLNPDNTLNLSLSTCHWPFTKANNNPQHQYDSLKTGNRQQSSKSREQSSSTNATYRSNSSDNGGKQEDKMMSNVNDESSSINRTVMSDNDEVDTNKNGTAVTAESSHFAANFSFIITTLLIYFVVFVIGSF